jgi:ribosomal protein L37E
MICNRCGAENDDVNRLCSVCGHKLQSREREDFGGDAAGGARTSGRPDETDAGQGAFLPHLGGGRPSMWGEMAFGWGVAVFLAGAAVWAIAAGVYWPLYPLTGLAALAAWRRARRGPPR